MVELTPKFNEHKAMFENEAFRGGESDGKTALANLIRIQETMKSKMSNAEPLTELIESAGLQLDQLIEYITKVQKGVFVQVSQEIRQSLPRRHSQVQEWRCGSNQMGLWSHG